MTYLPSDPKIYCLGSPEKKLESQYYYTNVIAVALALLPALLLGYVEICARRELRLARFGEVTEGYIIEKTYQQVKGSRIYWVRYRLHTPDEVRRTGWVRTSRALWEWLHVGSAITALYDPDNPDRHRPSFGLPYVQFQLAAEGE